MTMFARTSPYVVVWRLFESVVRGFGVVPQQICASRAGGNMMIRIEVQSVRR